MLYLGDLDLYTTSKILQKLPLLNGNTDVMSSGNIGKILRKVTNLDTAIIYNNNYRKIAIKISDICRCFPNKDALEFCLYREAQMKYIDGLGIYGLKRTYHQKTRNIRTTKGFIYKVGNKQCGEGKYIGDGGSLFVNDTIIEEEFIDGRSIRVLWVYPGYTYVIEHVNSRNQIKNVNPDAELILDNSEFKELIDNTVTIVNKLELMGIKSITYGFDYIVGDKIGLLEINDMCGLPDHKNIKNNFIDAIIYLYKNIL